MTAPPASTTRSRRVLGEVLRFLAVGGLATAVSFVGFNALVHGMLVDAPPLRDQPLVAFVLVNIVAGCVAYVGMRMWTFRDRNVRDHAPGLVRFFALGALTMAIPVLCLGVSRYGLGLDSPVADNLSANVIGLGLGAATRFMVFSRYVFDQVPTPEPAR
jgi:putative flippase GtrA